jgi:vacuolar-type H+-ATPase subunit E/Vma4
MEKALNEMRKDIGKKDDYQTSLASLKSRWETFMSKKEGLENCYESLSLYQNESQKNTEEIIKLTNLLKVKIKKLNSRLDLGMVYLMIY